MPHRGYKGTGGSSKKSKSTRKSKGSIALLNKGQRKQLEKLGYIKSKKK